jgi:proteasome lid subunit RPN8/RPN11
LSETIFDSSNASATVGKKKSATNKKEDAPPLVQPLEAAVTTAADPHRSVSPQTTASGAPKTIFDSSTASEAGGKKQSTTSKEGDSALAAAEEPASGGSTKGNGGKGARAISKGNYALPDARAAPAPEETETPLSFHWKEGKEMELSSRLGGNGSKGKGPNYAIVVDDRGTSASVGFTFLPNSTQNGQSSQSDLQHRIGIIANPKSDELTLIPTEPYVDQSMERPTTWSSRRPARSKYKTDFLGKGQPFKVQIMPEVIFLGDFHAHMCGDEVIGYLGGQYDAEQKVMVVQNVFPVKEMKIRDSDVYAEMDPVQAYNTIETIRAANMSVVGWYHSHPTFDSSPSICDVRNHSNFQRLYSQGESATPYIGMIFNPFQKGRQALTHSKIQIFHTRTVQVAPSKAFASAYTLSIPVKIVATLLQYEEEKGGEGGGGGETKGAAPETSQFIPARQSALLKQYCDRFGHALRPTLSQAIQLVEYYKKKKQRVKITKLKKNGKLESMLDHNAYGLPLSKGLLSHFAKQLSTHVCEAFARK